MMAQGRRLHDGVYGTEQLLHPGQGKAAQQHGGGAPGTSGAGPMAS